MQPLTMVRCSLDGGGCFESAALRDTLFAPSASSGFLELTSAGRVVFAFCRVEQKGGADGAWILTVPVTALVVLRFRCIELAPALTAACGVIDPAKTQVLVQDPLAVSATAAALSASPRTLISNLRSAHCPWLSDVAAAEVESHMRLLSQSAVVEGIALPRGILIRGEHGSGKRALAFALARAAAVSGVEDLTSSVLALDCAEFAQLCVLHGAGFNPLAALRNVLRQWSASRPLVLLNLDTLDGGAAFSAPVGASVGAKSASGSAGALPSFMMCSLPERTRRMLLIELAAAFRQSASAASNKSRLFWIATTSSPSSPLALAAGSDAGSGGSASITTALSRWIATVVTLGVPDFAQRRELFASELHSRLGLLPPAVYTEEELQHRLLVATHGWTLAALFNKASLREIVEREQLRQSSDGEDARDVVASAHAPPAIFGMDEDLQVIGDACVTPLCRVARDIREGRLLLADVGAKPKSGAVAAADAVGALPKGILCVGGSGQGKTLLLRHLAHHLSAHDTGVAVILQDTLALVHKEVGATELAIHQLFERARASAPCVLLLDHLDSVAAPRSRLGGGADSSAQVADRMLSTLLIEMDGVATKTQRDRLVLVVATAPSLDALDPAVRRPGRLDIHVHVRPPTVEHAVEMMLARLARSFPDAGAAAMARNYLLHPEGGRLSVVGPLLSSYAEVDSFCVRKLIGLVSGRISTTAAAAAAATVATGDDEDVDHVDLSFASMDDWIAWISGP